MKPLQIDFSGRSRLLTLNTSDPIPMVFAGLLVLGAVLLAAGIAVGARLNAQSSHLADAIAKIESTQRVNDESSAQIGDLSVEETEAVNAAVMQLNYPWLDFFKGLEKQAIPGVTLVSVETGVTRQSTRIVIDAPGIDEAVSYVQALKLEPIFSTVTLVKQESIVADNATTMRFTLEAPIAGIASGSAAKSAATRRGGV